MQASAANADDQALAVGSLVAFRLFGALIGLAIASTVLSSVFETSLAVLQPLPAAITSLGGSSQAIGSIPILKDLDIPSDLFSGIIEVYKQSFRVLWYVMAGFACVGFLSGLFISEESLETEQTGKQHLQTRRMGSNSVCVA